MQGNLKAPQILHIYEHFQNTSNRPPILYTGTEEREREKDISREREKKEKERERERERERDLGASGTEDKQQTVP